jgi:hypothetical protein
LPVNHLVRDASTGDLYAATDFGVLVLAQGSSRWREAGEGLPTVLTPYLQILPNQRVLFAGTHGRGAWYLKLKKERCGDRQDASLAGRTDDCD